MYSAFRYVSLLKTENADQRGDHTVTSASDKGAEVSLVLATLHDYVNVNTFYMCFQP
jgi:hypothetical protein